MRIWDAVQYTCNITLVRRHTHFRAYAYMDNIMADKSGAIALNLCDSFEHSLERQLHTLLTSHDSHLERPVVQAVPHKTCTSHRNTNIYVYILYVSLCVTVCTATYF